jgi:glutathione peroxidase
MDVLWLVAFLLDVLQALRVPTEARFFIVESDIDTIYQFSAPLLDGHPVSLAKFRGQVLLIVNTASQCGFTPQYAGLEALYRTYRDRDFTVLGFPCNQFGNQEPSDETEIGVFCTTHYGVSFPLFAKIDVNGPRAHPLYRFLRTRKPGLFGFIGSGAIRWNFTKFLIDRQGRVVARYAPAQKPAALKEPLERLLAAR